MTLYLSILHFHLVLLLGNIKMDPLYRSAFSFFFMFGFFFFSVQHFKWFAVFSQTEFSLENKQMISFTGLNLGFFFSITQQNEKQKQNILIKCV